MLFVQGRLVFLYFHLFCCDFILLIINHCYFPWFIKTVTLGNAHIIQKKFLWNHTSLWYFNLKLKDIKKFINKKQFK